MNKIIPKKLKIGDEIRVIAPSSSMAIVSENVISLAKTRLENLGFKVSFGKNARKISDKGFYSIASIKDRIEDLHDAFKDKNVKAILTVLGGFNVNQILEYIDYDLIKSNPKIICGYSDITALLNAIYAKTGLVAYYGPHFSTFGMKYGNEYTEKYFKKMFIEDGVISLNASEKWSNDKWYKNQEERKFILNDGMESVFTGTSNAEIIGGNLCTLNLLQGTEFMPKVEECILFIEDDGMAGEEFLVEFDRNLVSLVQAIGKNKIKGIIVGRAEINCNMNYEKWKELIKTKNILKNIPVIVGADFGHTTPMFTFPIGGIANISNIEKINIQISDK